jgi:hypothetical protein
LSNDATVDLTKSQLVQRRSVIGQMPFNFLKRSGLHRSPLAFKVTDHLIPKALSKERLRERIVTTYGEA